MPTVCDGWAVSPCLTLSRYPAHMLEEHSPQASDQSDQSDRFFEKVFLKNSYIGTLSKTRSLWSP